MTNVLAAGVLAAVISVVVGPWFIAFLRANRVGQNIRDEGPEGHQTKQGTPTMGGFLIVVATVLPYLAFSDLNTQSLAILAAMLGCAAIGLVDDWRKVVARRSLGLRGRYKLLGQLTVAVVISAVAQAEGVSTRIFLPFLDTHVDLGWAWFPLVFLMIVGASNAVNLTDGLDGLAAGTTTIAVLAYTAMLVIGYEVSTNGCPPEVIPGVVCDPDEQKLDMAVLAASLLGSCTGFLWFNSFPADVFMGDTGSLALGGAVAAFAVFTKTELLLPLIGGVFVIEALSVIIQVISFKRFGRRVFLMAPIHHHFEMRAWSETKIMVRFWIMAAVFASSGFVLYYLRFDQYV